MYEGVPTERCFGLWPSGTQVIEVKSIGGQHREWCSAIDEGRAGIGSKFETRVVSAAFVLAESAPLIERAARKTKSTAFADARHAMLIVHPMERLVAEWLNHGPLLIHHLPRHYAIPEPLDALWVLWYPDVLTVWSRQRNCWTLILLTAKDEEEELDSDPLMTAEREFRERIGSSKPSPFDFRLRSEPGLSQIETVG